MQATARALCVLSLIAAGSACKKSGGGGGGEPPIAPNSPPSLSVATQLVGSGSVFRFTLAVGGNDTLAFSATDPDDDPLRWQLVGDGAAATAVGVTLPLPVTGPTFSFDIAAVTLPATAALVLFVEDTRGNAAAIDLTIIRTGPPTITGTAPNSAFVTQSQAVTITGTALSLAGTANTIARFGGIPASGITIPNETTLNCSTPGMSSGGVVVSVSNANGTAALPASAFTAFTYPPTFGATDQALGAAAGSAPAVALAGDVLHAVWLEGGVVVHRVSGDGGTTWSTAQTLSGGEIPTEPQVVADGQNATVVWVGDGTTMWARNSTDGGASFQAGQVLNPAAGSAPAARPRLCASGDRQHLIYLQGDASLGMARVVACTSNTAGALWTPPVTIDDGSANQSAQAVVCDGESVWVAFLDLRQGGAVQGVYTSRSINGGLNWSAANRRTPAGTTASEPLLCQDGTHVHVTWLRSGVLDHVRSSNSGLSYATLATELSDSTAGIATAPAITCSGANVYAIYVDAGSAVWIALINAAGSLPQRQMISTATVSAAFTNITKRGNYIFTAWRSDDVGTGLARILQSLSTDVGNTFTVPSGFGDGTAAQDAPLLLAQGARETLFWLDSRGGPPTLFTNRNNP